MFHDSQIFMLLVNKYRSTFAFFLRSLLKEIIDFISKLSTASLSFLVIVTIKFLVYLLGSLNTIHWQYMEEKSIEIYPLKWNKTTLGNEKCSHVLENFRNSTYFKII